MGIILGGLAIVAGIIGIRYSVVAILAGISAILTYVGIKRD